MEKPYVVGIDIGGQTAKIGIVNAHGEILAQTVIRSDQHTDADLFIQSLCETIKNLAAANKIEL
ncbi:MAG TPA: ROK family protein, partial [Paludibacteraceae bacterium]|nr:ROK family protein [Paludibacteraceae bacterium]